MTADRLVPVSGAAAVVLIFASFAAAGNTPAAEAQAGKLVSYYGKHHTGQIASSVLLGLGALLFLIFAARLAGSMRGATSALCLGGGILLVAGLTVFAALALALGDLSHHIDPVALQAVNVLDQEMFIPITVGTSAFLLGAGTAVLRTRALARWLGWLAIGFAVVAPIPSHVLGGPLDHIGFLGFAGLGVWTLIVSVQLARGKSEWS